jgi:hypothetical protein
MEDEAVAMGQAQVREELVLGAMGEEGDMGMHTLQAMQIIIHGDQQEWTPTILHQQG